MNTLSIFICLIGLALLILGADFLVRGASRLALCLGLSPLVVGLTVVAFGTSTPELFISVLAGWNGQADLALGNVLGSNIFNILVILGVSALITPLAVSRQLIRLDVPIMIGVSALLLPLGWLGGVSRLSGLMMCIALLGYLLLQLRLGSIGSMEPPTGDREATTSVCPVRPSRRIPVRSILLVLLGLFGLTLGSRLFIHGAVAIAQNLGVSELVIGLTLVAGGTSLPEVAASVVAALRGERDMAVGNVVGSNIFNLLGVLGLAALVSPSGIAISPAVLRTDIPIMLATAVACLPLIITGKRIDRREGAFFLAAYLAYCTWLFLAATG